MSPTPTKPAPKTILVTGATGRQGSGVITALLSSPQAQAYTILALTRDPTSRAAQNLALLSPRIKLLKGDLDSPLGPLFSSALTLLPPLTKIWGVFSVQVSMGKGVTEASEVKQGCNLIDAAIEHGVRMFVYSSVERGGDEESWDNETLVSHFRSKYKIEQHLRQATRGGEMQWTILRPVAFMDNLSPGFEMKVFLAALRNKVPANKKVQWVASQDIGAFAAMAFERPDVWAGRAVGLAGDELTMDELSEVFEKAVGRPALGTYWVLGSLLTTVVKEMGLMIGWFASDGYKADVRARRGEYPALMDLEAYLGGNAEWQAVAVR